MKKIVMLAAAITLLACATQEKTVPKGETTYATIEAEVVENAKQESKYGQILDGDLHGLQNKEAFMNAPFSNWFTSGFENYTPDAETAAALQKAMKGVEVRAYMGTWCGDSQREVPHFYKLISAINFKEKNVTMISVDSSKKQPEALVAGYEVLRVPTFIFYKNGKEIGRYVEYARESMEEDFLKISSGQDYKHSYQN
jgi:thiol-disulfide isomerase/thioredoxin